MEGRSAAEGRKGRDGETRGAGELPAWAGVSAREAVGFWAEVGAADRIGTAAAGVMGADVGAVVGVGAGVTAAVAAGGGEAGTGAEAAEWDWRA
jgi:hypothetical protein